MEDMKLSFVNVGYGEAILLECPDQASRGGVFTMLIDGGGADPAEFADRSSGRIPLHEYLRAHGPGHLDLMVNTHPHEDHVSGLRPVAAMLPPAELWQTLPPDLCRERMRELDVSLARNLSQDKFLHALNDCAALSRAVEDAGGTVRRIEPGMSGELCRGLRYTVLAPNGAQLRELEERFTALYAEKDEEAFLQKLNEIDSQLNNRSIILLLEYKGTRLLLPGDTNRAGYGEIDPASLRAELFKVGHHGQRDGADDALLAAVSPSAVVCCASSDQRYHSAEEHLMRSIADCGAKRFFSDCPPVVGETIPPHSALVFTIGADGAIEAEYR
ncbi:MAG: hypothetical protein IJJ43_02150 [Oscillospiraceae bacterium]|nr:hypothetical protein [Oscillospiraceae bacterium]